MEDYLYHYTSIETLALILKNRKIRFNRLDLVDDPEEPLTKDYGNLGRFMFASCWTNQEKESLSMWHMYSKNMHGVRIKMPSYFMKELVFKEESVNKENGVTIKNSNGTFTSYVDLEMIDNLGYMTVSLRDNILKEIKYTEEEGLLYPNVVSAVGDSITLDIGKIGGYKNECWSFQKEFRYLFFVSPWNKKEILNSTPEHHIQLFERLKNKALDIDFIDFEIDPEKFKDMTIKLGPRASNAEKIIVQSLINSFNPNATLEESTLKVR